VEGALLVAEKALAEVQRLTARVAELEASAKSANSFIIDQCGDLAVATTAGELKSLGRVRGLDGKDADMDTVHGMIINEVAKRVGATVEKAVAALPPPERGEPGPQGPAGDKGEPGPAGLGFDDMDVESKDEGRTIVFSFERGDLRQTFELGFSVPLYRGVFRDGQTYLPGDEVTSAGSTWHCNKETGGKPGDGSADWTLKVKRGRDGKDGIDGKDLRPPSNDTPFGDR